MAIEVAPGTIVVRTDVACVGSTAERQCDPGADGPMAGNDGPGAYEALVRRTPE